MSHRSDRDPARRSALGWSAGIVAAMLAPLLGGCVTEADRRPNGPTIAFESIDGPPRPVFDRLVARLDAVARSRQVAVVSRESPARYRVRAYLAAKIERHRTAIVWVWDVYDSDLRRAARLVGEEPAGRNPGDAWGAATDQVLGRIAESGMTQLAAFAAAPGTPSDGAPAAPQTAPPADPPAVAPGEIRVAAVPSTAATGNGRR